LFLGTAAVALTAITWTATSRAEGATAVAQPAAKATVVAVPGAEVREAYAGPNRTLLGTGLVTFAISYIPSVIVASESSLPADHHLYVPVAGPWLNLANRPGCPPSSTSCDTETANRVVLTLDGVLQGIGVLGVVASLLMPEHVHAVVAPLSRGPRIHLSPERFGDRGYGLTASGSF
jgi:hypothetical protein